MATVNFGLRYVFVIQLLRKERQRVPVRRLVKLSHWSGWSETGKAQQKE
jgi:hypothetical protein